jgi:aldose sugar dehydrogenase
MADPSLRITFCFYIGQNGKGFKPMRLIILLSIISTIAVPVTAGEFPIESTRGIKLAATRVATFDEPWAMTFLTDETLLVTEKRGVLWHVANDGSKTEVQGLWKVAYGGQGGLGDVVLHPDFENNSWVYLSYAERADDNATFGAVVVRAKLDINNE